MADENCDECGCGGQVQVYRRVGWTTNSKGKTIPVLQVVPEEEIQSYYAENNNA